MGFWPFKKKEKMDIQSEIDQGVGRAVQRIKNQLGYSSSPLVSSSRSGGAKYAYGLSASGISRTFDHKTIRRNIRDAYQDSVQAKSVIDRFADSIADVGLKLECSPAGQLLPMNDTELEEWSQEVEYRFDLWARDKKQHRSENLTFYQAHRKYSIFQQRDNDVFTRLFYSRDNYLQNPLQFEFIDPDQIRGDTYTTTYGVQNYNDGILRDERGREKTYKIYLQNKTEDSKIEPINIDRYSSSGLLQMLHGFDPLYAGQGRGYSRFAYALQEFENITDLSLAHIKKAINQSNIALYVKPSQDNAASNPVADILNNASAGPIIATPTSEEIEATGLAPVVSYSALPEATFLAPGSTGVFNLQGGEDLASLKETAPSDSYHTFVEAFTSHLSAASGMPIEVLLMKFGQNYSASRATLILFWRICQIWREEMAADFLDPIYHMWMVGEIAAGRIKAPGFSDPILRAAWLSSRWIGVPMPNIDPQRAAAADKINLELGAQTFDMVARNLNGSDGRSNRVKLSREVSELPEMPWNKRENTQEVNNDVKSDNG